MRWRKELGVLVGIAVAAAILLGPLWWRPAVPCVTGDLAARAQARAARERERVSSLRLEKPATLAQLWEMLARQYPEGVMFSGYVRAAPLHLIAIARPAIDGRAVLKHAADYYPRRMESAAESWVFVTGIAAAKSTTSRMGRGWLASLLTSRPDAAGHGTGLAYGLRVQSEPGQGQAAP